MESIPTHSIPSHWPMLSAIVWAATVAAVLRVQPRWSQAGFWFSVRVGPDFPASERGQRILAAYQRGVTVAGGAAILAVLALTRLDTAAFWRHGILLPQIALSIWSYALARRRVLPHAVAAGPPGGGPTAARRHLPGGIAGQAGPFVLLTAAAFWIAVRLPTLPARISVHYGPDLTPDRWATPSWPMLLGPLLLGATICGGLLLMAFGMARWSHPPADGAQAERLALMMKVLLGAGYLVAAVSACVGVAMLFPVHEMTPLTRILLVVVPESLGLILVVWLLVRLGQLQRTGTDATGIGDRTEDRFWKAGLVYYNPEDPAIFLEKRFGIGYTMNMARPAAWSILGAVLGVPLVVALLLALLE